MRVPRHHYFWLGAFFIWFVTLWTFSSGQQPEGILPPFQLSDKVAHFGYFFGGSGLLTAYFFTKSPRHPHWRVIALSVLCCLGLIGMLDEFHQSFVPGRSGNDPYDFLADLCGAAAGVWVFKITHRLFNWESSASS